MLNKDAASDPVALYRAATERAIAVAETVRPDQLGAPTPCTEWTVQQLLDHLVGGTDYLLSAATGGQRAERVDTTVADFRRGVDEVLDAIATPGAMVRTRTSPLGFEWPVAQALAGTFMDVLIHTWDIARATGQDDRLDPDLVDACIAMFLPDMPERGRAAGIIGPAVQIGADSAAQDRLLAAMGRRP